MTLLFQLLRLATEYRNRPTRYSQRECRCRYILRTSAWKTRKKLCRLLYRKSQKKTRLFVGDVEKGCMEFVCTGTVVQLKVEMYDVHFREKTNQFQYCDLLYYSQSCSRTNINVKLNIVSVCSYKWHIHVY